MSRMQTVPSVLTAASKFDAWVWARVAAGDQLELGSTYREFRDPEGGEPLTVITVISVAEPLAAVHQSAASGDTWYTSARGVGAIAVPGYVVDAAPFVVSSWPSALPAVYHVTSTVPATDRRWLRFERWLRDQAPDVVPVYLDRSDFDGFVTILGEHGTVDASRLTGRYRKDRSSYSRGWPNPKSARAALEEVADEVQLRTMTLAVLDSDRAEILLRLHLRRLAGATFYSGSFSLFQRTVLDRLAVAADRRARMFRNRFRTTEEPDVKPIEVRIGVSRFEDSDDLAHFVQRITRFPKSVAAVLHRNPYLQVAVTDYLDGSNFDLFITAVDRITIYPGYRASVGALVRLTDYLSEEFEADGVTEEYERGRLFKLADVFSSNA